MRETSGNTVLLLPCPDCNVAYLKRNVANENSRHVMIDIPRLYQCFKHVEAGETVEKSRFGDVKKC
ncbi:hypothetical protein IMSAGC009_04368 [Lachnospiraceae bacterium]|jgi:hypothetical protein|nr:hypothetical protein IMSAGC009_04368 [Lachnospiraceae bacterium]